MVEKLIIHEIEKTFSVNSNIARNLSIKSSIGEIKDNRVVYSIYEVLYLLENKRAELLKNNKNIIFQELLRFASQKNKNLRQKYLIYRDLKKKGYILKAGLKFGVDFRVYEKNKKPGKDHADYLCYILEEKTKINPQELCSKTRVAHSTAKKLLLALIDSEEDITYLEINWKKT